MTKLTATFAGVSARATTFGVDANLRADGSIALLRPLTDAARAWIAENLPADAQTFGGQIVIEPRYVADIVAGMQRDGLAVA